MGMRAGSKNFIGSAIVLTGVVAIVLVLDRKPASLSSTEGGFVPPRYFAGAATSERSLRPAVGGCRADPSREGEVMSFDPRLEKQLAWLAAVENPDDAELWLRELLRDGRVSEMRLARLIGDRERVSDRMAAVVHTAIAASAEVDERLRETLLESFRARVLDQRPGHETDWRTVVDDLNEQARMGSALDALPAEWTDRPEVFDRVVEIANGNDPGFLRVKAVEQLASARREESAALLRIIARRTDSFEIEAAAIRGLIGDADPETLDVVKEVLMRSTGYGPTERFAVRALGEFAESPEATGLLIAAYRETVDPSVQSAALHALASHAAYDAGARQILTDALDLAELTGLHEVAAFGLMRSPDVGAAIRAIQGCIDRSSSKDARVRLGHFLRALKASR